MGRLSRFVGVVALLAAAPAVAQQASKISNMPFASTPFNGSELLYVIQGGVSKKTNYSVLSGQILPLATTSQIYVGSGVAGVAGVLTTGSGVTALLGGASSGTGGLLGSTSPLISNHLYIGGGTPLGTGGPPPLTLSSQFIPSATRTTPDPTLDIERTVNYQSGVTYSPTLWVNTSTSFSSAGAWTDGIVSVLNVTANSVASGSVPFGEAVRGVCLVTALGHPTACTGGVFAAANASGSSAFGVEGETNNNLSNSPTPPSFPGPILAVGFFASSGSAPTGSYIADAGFMVNSYGGPFQVGFSCPQEQGIGAGNSIKYSCFEAAVTAPYAIDMSLGTWTTAQINGVGFQVLPNGSETIKPVSGNAQFEELISPGEGGQAQYEIANATSGHVGLFLAENASLASLSTIDGNGTSAVFGQVVMEFTDSSVEVLTPLTVGLGGVAAYSISAAPTTGATTYNVPAFAFNDLGAGGLASFPAADTHFAMTVTGNYNGGSSTGSYEGLIVSQYCGNRSETGAFCTGAQENATMIAGANNLGNYTANNPLVTIPTGVTGVNSAVGEEIDAVIYSPVGAKEGLRIIDYSNSGGYCVSDICAAIDIAKIPGAVGFEYGIRFNADVAGTDAQFPIIGTNGELIKATTTSLELAAGIDLWQMAGGFVYAAILLPPGGPGGGIWWGPSGQGGEINSDTSTGAGKLNFASGLTALQFGSTNVFYAYSTGEINLPALPTSAGSGGAYVCRDGTGNLYYKSSCP